MKSNSSVDKEQGLDPELASPGNLASDAEGERQIRERLGRFGLGKLFNAGGVY